MFPEPPEPPEPPKLPRLARKAAEGPWGGPSYTYRGARIECTPGGHECGIFMPEHPLHGRSFGVVGTMTALVDLWVETGWLPEYMR